MEMCKAYGCICVSTMNRLCRYHYGSEPREWPHITEQIKKNERLLKAIKWAMNETSGKTDKYVCETLMRLADQYPALIPSAGDSAVLWAYRAIGWLSSEVRPVKYHDAVEKIRSATGKHHLVRII